jgi:dolichol kinase
MILGQTLTALVFPAPIAVTAMTFGVVGDSAAAIIGTRYGRRRFLRGKSVEGSLACFAASFIGGGVWFLLPLPIVAAGALTTAFSEAVDSHINDNLIIPLAAACVMFALAA